MPVSSFSPPASEWGLLCSCVSFRFRTRSSHSRPAFSTLPLAPWPDIQHIPSHLPTDQVSRQAYSFLPRPSVQEVHWSCCPGQRLSSLRLYLLEPFLKRKKHTLSTYPLLQVCAGLAEDRSVMDICSKYCRESSVMAPCQRDCWCVSLNHPVDRLH